MLNAISTEMSAVHLCAWLWLPAAILVGIGFGL